MKHGILLMAGIASGIILFTGMAQAQLSPPTDVSASDGTFMNKVRVTWSEVTGATGYEVWRESGGGSNGGGNTMRAEKSNGAGNSDAGGNKIADVTTTMYDDTSAEAGMTYTYRVKSKDASSTSEFSTADTGWRGNNVAFVANADFDGDGLADLTVYQASAGTWVIRLSGNGYSSLTLDGFLGTTGYAAVAADYDGDGKADFAVFQASTGNWQFKLSGGGSYALTEVNGFLGGNGTTAAVADYDGDGKADPAVYSEATGILSLKLSGQGYAQLDVSL